MPNYNVIATAQITRPSCDEEGNPITVTFNPGDVVNVIVWDGVTPYTPPTGTELVLASD